LLLVCSYWLLVSGFLLMAKAEQATNNLCRYRY